MIKKIILHCLLLTVSPLLLCAQRSGMDLSKYVDPLIGSAGHGHVFVGASVPFGAVQVGPDNFNRGWDWCSSYHHTDSIIRGFSHLHLSGTGCTDLSDISIMPTTGKLIIRSGSAKQPLGGYASVFSHQNETAQAGYYAVQLTRYQIKAEMTASERVGFHQYQFPKTNSARLILNLAEGNADSTTKCFIQKIDKQTIVGYRFSKGWANDQQVYFAIKLSKPVKDFLIFEDSLQLKGNQQYGRLIKAVLQFTTTANELLKIKVGISPVSTENALENIQAEIPNWNFDEIRSRAQQAWNKELSKIEVVTNDVSKLKTFYTALYHTMIAPSLFNDHNKDYRGADRKIYTKQNFDNYTVFSLWDTYRAAHPLFTITQPKRTNDMINTMLAIYQQSGKLPAWHLMGCETNTMVGYHSVAVIVDAYLKGIRDYDVKLAYQALKDASMSDTDGLDDLKKTGYIPADKVNESVAKALEYAITDWCIAQMAKDLGKMDDYAYYSKRGKAYELYFDKSSHFMRGKLSNGKWRTPFDPLSSKHREDDYCEGNAWQYNWLVPQDVHGLIQLFGSEASFTEKLDSLFKLPSDLNNGASVDISGLIGQYAQGNEPGHHIPYLFAFAGQQWKTAEKIRYIIDHEYSDKTDGLCGNEDCGQMSAWYVFSALGFYSVNPANGVYVFGSPIFDQAKIQLTDNKEFKINIKNNSPQNIYIQSVQLNGKDYPYSYLLHKDLMKGGTLEITMGPQANKQFGAAKEFRPE